MGNIKHSLPSSEYVVVVGAGPAGLAVAYCLYQKGVNPLVLEQFSMPGASWHRHYRRRYLGTVRRLSHLPGQSFDRRLGRWISREQVVEYLVKYASALPVRIELETTVTHVDHTSDGWIVLTNRGKVLANQVVIATGLNCIPAFPELNGQSSYKRILIHASAYRDDSFYQGRHVLVIGAGNTGSEIALNLVEGGASHVALAIGNPPNFVPRTVFGIPLQFIGILTHLLPLRINDALGYMIQWLTIGSLSEYGVPQPTKGIFTQAKRNYHIPTIDAGTVEAIRHGLIEVVPAVIQLDGDDVVLSNGRRLTPDVIIMATGYKTGLHALVGHLNILDQQEIPLVRGGRASHRHPGLYFVGFDNVLSGNLRGIGIEARRVAQYIAAADR